MLHQKSLYLPEVIDERVPQKWYWVVCMTEDGNINYVTKNPIFDEETKELVVYKFAPYNSMGKITGVFEVFANDKEHAIKIVNEKRAMQLADNTWRDR